MGLAAWQYHLPDALGSVRQLADPTAQIRQSQSYDPFGGLMHQRSADGDPSSAYGFAGEQQDETGHLYLRARTYHPDTGRFLQTDPVLGTPQQPQTLHNYAYSFNNPVNFVDPSGQMPPGFSRSAYKQGPTPVGSGRWHAYQGARPPQHSYSGPRRLTRPAPGPVTSYSQRPPTQGFRGWSSMDDFGSSRSVNARMYRTTSDPYAKDKSQGHRPQACGLSDLAMGLGKSAVNGNLLKDVAGMGLEVAKHVPQTYGPLMDWVNDQVKQIKQAWEQRDWRMGVSIGYGVVMGFAVGALAASGVGLFVMVPAIAGMVAANAMFNALLYNDPDKFDLETLKNFDRGKFTDDFRANLYGGGAEMGLGVVGGAMGGPLGWLVGAVIGAGVGQAITNLQTPGAQWDDFLLGSMLFSGVAEGVGGAGGHLIGDKLSSRPMRGDKVVGPDGVGLLERYKRNGPVTNHGDNSLPGTKLNYLDVDRVRWDFDTERWRVVGNVEFNGKVYKNGQFVPPDAVYPPRRFGITPEMETAIMASLPEGHVAVFRDRPIGAAELDGIIDAKRGWIEDWMIVKKHEVGIRELVDAHKVVRGEYEHVEISYGLNEKTGQMEMGYDFYLDPKRQDPPVFVPHSKLKQFIDDGSAVHDNVDVAHLTGQYVLSDLDAAIYSDLTGSLVDKTYMQEFAQIFNEEYLGGLDARHHIISHGALYEGLTNKPEVVKKLSQVPGRIERLEAENVIVFANLPDKGKVGFQEVIPYKKAVKQFAGPYYKGTEKPWTTGATRNSIYTRFDPKTGRPKQTAIYDANGNVIAHIDWKQHGSTPPGHFHFFPEPGNPSSGHGPGKPHYLPFSPQDWGLPIDWNKLP